MSNNNYSLPHKRLFHLFGILIVIQCVSIQSIEGQVPKVKLKEQSDSLFTLGVEKYSSKQFEEAILFFNDCLSIDSLVFEPNSSRIGYASMWLASCYYKLGNIKTAASISDYYMSPPIDRRLTVNSDSISDLIYPILYEKGDGESALPLIREVLLLEKKELGEHNVWIGNTYSIYGYALLLSGHADDAINAYEQSLSILGELCGENSKPYIFILSDVINAYSSIGDYDSAYTNACVLLDTYKALNLDDSNIYYTAIATCGDCLLNQGKYEESLPYLLESLRILSKMNLENSLDYSIILAGLGRAQLLTGDAGKGKETLEKSYFQLKHSTDTYDKRYLIQCMDYLSQANYVVGDTITAIKMNKEAISLFEEGKAEKNYLYPELFFNLWNIFEALKEPKDAHLFAEKAIENYRNLDCKDINYASLLFRYSDCVSKENRYKYAIDLASEALSFMENSPHVHDSVLVMYHCKLAECYSNNGDMDSAYYHAQIALCDIKSKFAYSSLNYIHILSKLASVLWFSGKREETMNLYQESLTCVELYYPNSESHYDILNGYAHICQLSGLYTEAVDLQKKAVYIAEVLYGKDSEAYSGATTNLLQYSLAIRDPIERNRMASRLDTDLLNHQEMNLQNVRQQVILAFQQGNISKAESLIKDACQVISDDTRCMSIDYAWLLMLQAELYNSIGKSADALVALKTAYTIATGLFGKEKFDKYYYNYWNILGIANINMRQWDEAEAAFSNSISATKILFGEKNMEHLLPQAILATIKGQKGDAEGAAQMMSTLFEALRSQVFTNFATMSSTERSAFWAQVSAVFNPGMPFIAYNSHNPQYYGDGYNALLLSKGLLLNTDQEVVQLLINSKDEKGLELYQRLQMMQQEISNLQTKATLTSLTETDSLHEAIRHGERELISLSSAYGDYTRKLRYSWQDVKLSLEKNDVAIEFADFYDNEGNNIYVAFVLKQEMETPHIIRLFNYSDFSSLNSHKYYIVDSLYNLVWKPIEPYFSKDSRIFFSPQGVLHSIAIESLPSSNGICMSNRYAVYRLSSTRELCVGDSPNKEKRAVLYGDIDYDLDNESESNSSSNVRSISTNNNVEEVRQVRGAIMDELPHLPGTKVEVDSIALFFTQANNDARAITNKLATESSVKSLSSGKYTILHMATHGYYLPSSESEGSLLSMIKFQCMDSNQEDLSLLRSGLFFAGANTALCSNHVMSSDNDGILTAKEVANIDLHTIEMVSLSACQTGLGDVSGDGVFGIQRGFKKAGVKSLLMSLWNVDDRATCTLMTEFYKNWLRGLSKYDALESAKSRIKSIKGWEDPIYWAPFILLDGIN